MVLIPCSRGYDRIYYEKSLGHPYFLVEKYWRHFGICDITGKEIISPKYDHIVFWSREDYYEVELNGKKGVCDLNGKEIIPPKYDKIYKYAKYDRYEVELNGKQGMCDLNGKEIIPNWRLNSNQPFLVISGNNNRAC